MNTEIVRLPRDRMPPQHSKAIAVLYEGPFHPSIDGQAALSAEFL
jgi:hypothetical protein